MLQLARNPAPEHWLRAWEYRGPGNTIEWVLFERGTHPAEGRTGELTSWRMAATATAHCLTGCAIGEVLGMVIGTAARLTNLATVLLSIVLAFAPRLRAHHDRGAAAALTSGAR